MSYEQRETVYERSRAELMYQFRNSKKCVSNVCRGFFLDQRHLENMFRFLSKTSLIGPIEDRFIRQIDLMEAYLRETIQNADFYEFLEMIEQKCNNEYDGALHFKWINIIVWKLFELH